jgi:energy-coupling factor transporter ATP-binding protein EcfA2
MLDPWIQAYCDPTIPEIFSSITTPAEIWKHDPFDVETIHQEARERFAQLVDRVIQGRDLSRGSTLVLLGESGSGKTHLMRAFRNYVHSRHIGYCAYMQMTTQTSNYARYLLNNLVDSLDKNYDPTAPDSSTALNQLSRALVSSIPSLTEQERQDLADSEGDFSEVIAEYADRLTALDRFHNCDLELIRIFLHFYREDHRVRNRVAMWLRCQHLSDLDRRWIGQAVPRVDEADPLRMLCAMAQLIGAIQNVPLIFLIDQLEDLQNLEQPVEQFRRLVDTITTLTDQAPNTMVVLACLEDYFIAHQQQIPRSKLDRLQTPFPPVRLMSQRSSEEIYQLVEKRLTHLYEELGLEQPPSSLHPFTPEELDQLRHQRTRDILNQLRQHQERCRQTGCYVRFPSDATPPPPPEPPDGLEEAWNDFLAEFSADVPEDEESIAALLTRIVACCSAEMSNGVHFGHPQADRNFIELEIHTSDGGIDRRLIAVCNKKAQGGGLLKQLEQVQRRAGEIPVVLVRTLEFPKSGQTTTLIAQLIKQKGRRVLLHNSDLRYMLAYEAFAQQQRQHPHFSAWQRHGRPLTRLQLIRDLLHLEELSETLGKNGTSPAGSTGGGISPQPPPISIPPYLPPELLLGTRVRAASQPVTLPVQVLTQHAAFLGGTGSGKTTAALNVIEQLLARGIPAILVDRKGDLSRYADPHAWQEPLSDPQREAMRTALRQRLEIALYTPGETNGCPLALPLVPRHLTSIDPSDRDLLARHTATALGKMMNLSESHSDQAKLAILTKALELLGTHPEQRVTIPLLRDLIADRDDELVAAVGGTYRERYYLDLAERLQTLWVRYEKLFSGPNPLDLDALLRPASPSSEGKVRLTILCTRFLPDETTRDFWLAQFFIALGQWCGSHPRTELQAVLFLDEADAYLPAVGRAPATKAPLEHLLRRARSAGLGLLLATQSPGDFDYRCRENITTWFFGRITQERALQKIRPLLELNGSSQAMDRLPKLETGEFYLVTPSTDRQLLRSQPSWIRTQQLPEEQIRQLARQSCPSSPAVATRL